MTSSNTDRFYFRQLLSGRDFATQDNLAHQMVNFVYLIGDLATRECVVVDPAYAVTDIVKIAQQDEMQLTGILATHYHPDHVGGSMMGMNIQGIAALLENYQLPVHVNTHEANWILKTTGVDEKDLVQHVGGDKLSVGELSITFVHTPGHTPGSQCFLVENRLVAGDTLFLDGCGRTDLPGADPSQMYSSLKTLASLSPDIVVCPGHQYSAEATASLGTVVANNHVFAPQSEQQWLEMFSR